jgi:hypothetical protein
MSHSYGVTPPRLRADFESGEGHVFYPKTFERETALMRADLLQDWINDLRWAYKQALNELYGEPLTKKAKKRKA